MKKVSKTKKNVKTAKKIIVKKASSKVTKNISKIKTAPAKKTVKKPAAKKITVKKPAVKPVIKPVPVKKTTPAPVQPNLSLPDGSEYQQTGLRRPLIVFPK